MENLGHVVIMNMIMSLVLLTCADRSTNAKNDIFQVPIMITMRSKKIIRMTSSRSPSEIGGSLADSDSLRSRESNRPKLSEVH